MDVWLQRQKKSSFQAACDLEMLQLKGLHVSLGHPLAQSITQLHAENSHQCLTSSTKDKKRTHLLGIRHLQTVDQNLCALHYSIRNVSSVTSHRLYPTWILCCLIIEFILQSFSLWGF